jgi:hypothetical protein
VTDDDLIANDRVLESDTRLRDALRDLRARTEDRFLRPDELSKRFTLARPSAFDETRHAVDVAVLAEAELIRLQRRVDDLGVRARAFERPRDRHERRHSRRRSQPASQP